MDRVGHTIRTWHGTELEVLPESLHPLTETTDAAKQGAFGVRWLGNAFFFKPLRTRQTVHSRQGDFRSRGAL